MQKTKKLPTHLFLASLGKTRLRPGGKEATDRIISACGITSKSKVLEVGPNMGTTAIYLAKTFGCHITGIDNHAESVEKARANIRLNKLEDFVNIQQGNALDLPFEEGSFDVVINEAMLTMLQDDQKKMAISEYYRVLKQGGKLATHDLLLKQNVKDEGVKERLNQLRKLLFVNAQPMTEDGWNKLFEEVGFHKNDYQTGKMSLLSLKGLIDDEGWDGLFKIINNARKDPEKEAYLYELIEMFDKNDDLYGHITFNVQK